MPAEIELQLTQLQFHARLLFGFGFPHTDCDIFAQSGEEPEDAFIGKTVKVAPHEFRNIGLGQSHHFAGLSLRKSLFLDEACDADNQVGLQQTNVGVRKTDICKDVTAAFCASVAAIGNGKLLYTIVLIY